VARFRGASIKSNKNGKKRRGGRREREKDETNEK